MLLELAHDKLVSPTGLAVIGGLAAHYIFRAREPSFTQFAGVVAAVYLSAAGYHHQIVLDGRGASADSAIQAGLVTVAFLVSLSSSILHYRLISRSHPLHGIPGPLLARCTQFWLLFRVVHGQTRLDMRAVHAKYGDVVRIGPNEVSIATAEAFLTVHGGKSWIKGASYAQTASGMSSTTETSLISLRSHNMHTGRRKLWDKAFAMQALKDYQEVVHVRIEQFLEQVNKHVTAKQEMDLHAFFGFFVWDVMTDLAYGGGGAMLNTASDTDNSLGSLCSTLHLAGVNKIMPWFSVFINMTPVASTTVAFRQMATKLFKKRLAQGRASAERDVFYYLLGEESDGTEAPLTDNELAADSALVIAAGADTTRLVMSTLMMFLMRHPDQLKELQSALDKALGPPGGVLSAEALASIPILDAYINETLRLNPPVPFANQREAPDGGATIGPHYIGAGSQVRFACYAIQRDPRYFSEPEHFKPARWMPGNKDGVLDKRAFFPFLAGPYHCVGKQFAMQEMRMLIATLVHKYDISPAQSFDSKAFEQTMQDRGLIEIHQPLLVHLTERT